MLTITPHIYGCLLEVRAQPNAKRNTVVGEFRGSLKVAVSAPPEDGRANEAIMDLLRTWLGLKRSQIELHSGHRSKDKLFLIREVQPHELHAMIGKKW